MTDIEYVTKFFYNETYLKRKAKQIIITDTTNKWGCDGKQSTQYIMDNKSSYEIGVINNYSRGEESIDINIFKIGRKIVSKEEWLRFNNIKRKTSIKLWTHPIYRGRFDKLINNYINYKI